MYCLAPLRSLRIFKYKKFKKINVMKTLKIFDFLCEMRTYSVISDEDMEIARVSKITTGNNREMKELLSAWMDGAYDEDPESLTWELTNLL
jgi:hypothetical protein